MRSGSVSIEYCPGCKWMFRATWLAQEVLSTFETNIKEVVLKPADEPGTFIIKTNDAIVWDRTVDGGFPEAKILKRRVRDIILPEKDLGHSDK
ncbi:MAG: SelT/SelW/SelH family protein [Lentisphaeraceae bacterium]|nr:SelT/SelW/SelH family protein [Lentisphaeraceae bacterium]